jgi:hypothetical protein
MTSRIWIYSGTRLSNSAKELVAHGGFLRLRPNRYHKVKKNDIVVNWGTTDVGVDVTFNAPVSVKLACNKLKSFDRLKDFVAVPIWTKDPKYAASWNCTFLARTKLTGHSGDGIIVVPKGCDDIPLAPLYVQYIYKVREYRVHVFHEQVIDTQRKIRDPNREVSDWKVRSHQNGFIFARNGVEPSHAREIIAIDAINALDLDFGAVDIIEDKEGQLYVLEVNTAPGLEGQTVTKYMEAIRGCAS